MSKCKEALRLNRQFIIGPRIIDELKHWNSFKLDQLNILCAHPNLIVGQAVSDGNKNLVLIGDVFDPYNIGYGNKEISEDLLANTTSFEDFEKYSKRYSGHWLCYLNLNGDIRIYPDACGMRSMHYTQLDNNEYWMGSQPGLFHEYLGVEKDQKILSEFRKYTWPGWWPGNITPFKNTFKLPSNHYLDLNKKSVYRFWPTEGLIKDIDLESASLEISKLLSNIIMAISSRGKIIVSITGGYDSRMIFACTDKSGNNISAYTLAEPRTSSYDISIPRKLCNKFKIKYQLLRGSDKDIDLLDIYRKNTGYSFWDIGSVMVPPLNKLTKNAFIVNGLLGEIFRSFYAPKLNKISTDDELTASVISNICEFSDNKMAIKSFSDWLDSLPKYDEINILDMLYWEQRAGNWASCSHNGSSTFVNSIPALNCRELLEIALAVDEKFKVSPYLLARKICEKSEPSVLDLPFNTSIRNSLREFGSKFIPWRIRIKYEGLKYTLYGLKDTYKLKKSGFKL